MTEFPWSELGIEPTEDTKAVRKAYSGRLKALDVDNEIEAFARLRNARDYALHLAKEGLPSSREPEPLYGDDSGLADSELIRVSFTGGEGGDDGGAGLDTSNMEAGESRFEDVPAIHEQQPEEPAPDQLAAAGLVALLLPDGEYSDEALTFAEYEEAQGHLAVLFKEAEESDIARGEGISAFIADWLAETWPRSSPVLEETATQFSWPAQSGQLNEPPALQFLNVRLRGMRFAEKVEQPDHPLHDAWMELKRPGKRKLTDAMRVKQREVDGLLQGIRARYPEVESYLDDQRVLSWDERPVNWTAMVIQGLAILFFGAIVLGGIFGDSKPDSSAEAPPVMLADNGEMDGWRDEIAAELFGEGRDMEWVRTTDSEFHGALYRAVTWRLEGGVSLEEATGEGINLGRNLMLYAAKDAPKAKLLEIARVKRDLMAAASNYGADSCRDFLRSERLDPAIEVPAAARAGERALMSELLNDQFLSPSAQDYEASTVSIPGWASQRLSERVNLPEDDVTAALIGNESPHTCTVRGALIDVLLERPSDVPVELLRIL